MTDSKATELLRKLLDERGVSCQTNYLHASWRVGPKLYDAVDNFDGTLTVDNLTPEQAITATLGSERHAYELRIIGDGSDWGEIMRDAYDDLMASANESCTPGEIADLEAHIAAELGSGTCEMARYRNALGYIDEWQCSECGANVGGIAEDTPPNFCPNCGKAVKR